MPQNDDRSLVYPLSRRLAGRLIAVEGIDGSGKSTQAQLLAQWLRDKGYIVHETSWNSSPLIKRDLRRAKRRTSLTPRTFSLMHAADLAERLEREILCPLRAGQLVLADRWVYTALTRDVARGMDPNWLRALYAMAPRPHLTVYFRVPVEVALRRIAIGRSEIRYYEAGMDLGLASTPQESFLLFQRRVVEQYEQLVQSDGLEVIDAVEPVAIQQKRLRAMADRVLHQKRIASPRVVEVVTGSHAR